MSPITCILILWLYTVLVWWLTHYEVNILMLASAVDAMTVGLLVLTGRQTVFVEKKK